MIKKILIFSAWFFISESAFAQQLSMKSHMVMVAEDFDYNKNLKTNIGNAGAGIATDLNFVPLFGKSEKSQDQIKQDVAFLVDCDKNFNTRSEASDFFSKMGWTYLEDGEKFNAINRFNLSYLLNNNNPESYWGLGVIEYQSKNFKNAIELMNNALTLAPNNPILMVDLATIYIQLGNNTVSPNQYTSKAKELINNAIYLQPEYETAYLQLALVNILENDLDTAWKAFHKGVSLNPQEINQNILLELKSRKADPAGIYK